MRMLHRSRAQAALILSLLARPSVQQDGQAGVYWLFPKKDEKLSFHHNDVINVTWISSFDAPILITYCSGAKGVESAKQMNVSGYNASALVELDFDHADTTCWFDLKPDLKGGKGSNSESFAYVSEVGDAATIGLLSSATATPSPTGSSSTSTTTSSSVSSATTTGTSNGASTGSNAQGSATRTNLLITSTSSTTSTTSEVTGVATTEASNNNTSGTLSAGAKAGVGIGVSVGAIAVGALVALLYVRRRRRSTMTDEKYQPTSSTPMSPGGSTDVPSPYHDSEFGGGTTVYGQSPTLPTAQGVEPASASKYVFPQAFAMPQSHPHELASPTAPQELQGTPYPISELPDSRYR